MKTLKELLSKGSVGRKQPVVFAFGRFNPPTVGHQKLIDRVITMAKRVKGLPVLYVSASQDKKKNPLTAKQKLDYLKKVYPRGIKLLPATNKERTFMEILKNNFDKKYTDVYMIAGSDRVAEFKRLIKSYNGKDYNFDTVNVVSAGERDPDADGVSGISASKMREFATRNDYKNFRSNLMTGTKEKDAMKLFKDLKNQMGVRENMLAPSDNDKELREEYHNNEIFNINEYVENKKDGSVGRIIKRGPNYVQYEMEDGGVQKAWLEDLAPSESLDRDLQVESVDKKKLVLQKNSEQLKSFKSFDEEIDSAKDAQKKDKEKKKVDKVRKMPQTTPGQPAVTDIDNWTQGPDNADQIKTMRTFNNKTPGQDRDYSKLVTTRKFQKFEGTDKTRQDPDVADKKGTQPAKYYSGLSKSTKSARDAHFKKKTKVDDDSPSAYTPAPGDSKGKTKPSVHTKKFKQMYGEDTEVLSLNDVKMWALETSTINKFKDRYQTEWRIELDKAVADLLEQVKMEESKEAGLKKKAEKSGMPIGVLRKVYNRGMAAWRTGHRPGTTPQQWAMARVNSFVTKSSGTWGKADSDLAKQVRGK
jgi:nicotinic acid mononucleotide adenylyltransferase